MSPLKTLHSSSSMGSNGIGRAAIGREVFLYKFRRGVGEAEANARYPRAMVMADRAEARNRRMTMLPHPYGSEMLSKVAMAERLCEVKRTRPARSQTKS